MNRSIPVLLACCLAAPCLAAETAAERGKRVVDESLKALGGDAFLKMQDRVETGRAYSFYHSEITGLSVAKIYTRYIPEGSARAGAVRVIEREAFYRTEARRDEESAVLFAPDGAWTLTYRGAVPFADERVQNRVDATRRDFFYILRCRRDEPWDYYSRGTDIVDNRPVEVVEITDAAGETVTVYFGQNDKFPVRQMYRRRNPTFKDFDTEVTVFDKYRDAGSGVKWPLDIRRERNADKIYEMYSDSVQVNQNLPDNLFAIPGSMKILPKPK